MPWPPLTTKPATQAKATTEDFDHPKTSFKVSCSSSRSSSCLKDGGQETGADNAPQRNNDAEKGEKCLSVCLSIYTWFHYIMSLFISIYWTWVTAETTTPGIYLFNCNIIVKSHTTSEVGQWMTPHPHLDHNHLIIQFKTPDYLRPYLNLCSSSDSDNVSASSGFPLGLTPN